MEVTFQQVGRLSGWGYPFLVDEEGREGRSSLQGPGYVRLMRRRTRRAGVRILDHSPALELLVDAEGVVAGAAGVRRQDGFRPWLVRASAVVLATGGCAFLSGALGLNVDTGDGHLMAAEVGAELSGMEFSSAYGLAPAFGAETKGLMYQFATYSREDGTELEVESDRWRGREALARALLSGPVYARLDKAPPGIHLAMRQAQPNFFLPFDKAGIDPFRERFQIHMVLEGTVRGTGGLRLLDEGCATTVPGLYAAGDVATRELITGGISGGGSHNGAWAIASGTWAGAAAARFARQRGALGRRSRLQPAGRFGLRPASMVTRLDAREALRLVQAEVTPLDRNLFRTGKGFERSLHVLDDLWEEIARRGRGRGEHALAVRQVAAMVAHARWMYRAALARPESRAMHRREDLPGSDPSQRRRLLVGGLEEVWTAPDPVLPLIGGPARSERRDRGAGPVMVHRLRPLRSGLPHERVRGRAPGGSEDRPSARLPGLLHVRGLLPGRRALCGAAVGCRRAGLSLFGQGLA